jgi:lipopolysaccharide export system permease protein
MGSIARYIFRTTTTAFIVVLVSLTALIWVTQALRSIDLLTNRGQSIFVFVGITGLVIPLLILVIAPVALFIAVAHTLNKLSNDSEIIVMNAAGMSPWMLFRAFVPVILLVCALVAATSTYFAPKGMRMLRDWLTQVNANVVSNIVQPGRFVTIVDGVTIHIAAREPNGQLRGVFLDDRRNAAEHLTVVADRGDLVENNGTFLVLHNGTIQREESSQRDPTMVAFDRYAVDLAQFSRNISAVSYSIRERFLWQLMFPDASDRTATERRREYRAELFDRLMAPIYPLVFAIIVFAYLGAPRTTRESRAMSLAGAVAGIFIVRMIGFASTVLGVNNPPLLFVQYIVVAAAIAAGIYVIRRGIIIEPPAFIANGLSSLAARLSRRFATS